jgi:protoporphyrin/coproporphyrin ferrochelatase
MAKAYDALLVVSFGGPDKPEDVLPFLQNVLRGRNVPRERMLDVAQHYYQFGGRSPINDQNRALIAALEKELADHRARLPVYWGNRNWHPLLPDTIRKMADDGVRRALAFVTSAYSSYSSCRQYLENIASARAEVGDKAPQIDKLRAFYNHPGFIEPMIENTRAALQKIPIDRQQVVELVFSAHSIPLQMAANCEYEKQLQAACRLVAEGVGRKDWALVYQSRSGPPQQPWLGPDIGDFLRKGLGLIFDSERNSADSTVVSKMRPDPSRDVIIVPIGFISDHMEVVYDLDTEVGNLCGELGINMVRAATVGTHPRFIRMIRELVEERTSDSPTRLALGTLGPSHDVCLADCCKILPNHTSLETKN